MYYYTKSPWRSGWGGEDERETRAETAEGWGFNTLSTKSLSLWREDEDTTKSQQSRHKDPFQVKFWREDEETTKSQLSSQKDPFQIQFWREDEDTTKLQLSSQKDLFQVQISREDEDTAKSQLSRHKDPFQTQFWREDEDTDQKDLFWGESPTFWNDHGKSSSNASDSHVPASKSLEPVNGRDQRIGCIDFSMEYERYNEIKALAAPFGEEVRLCYCGKKRKTGQGLCKRHFTETRRRFL